MRKNVLILFSAAVLLIVCAESSVAAVSYLWPVSGAILAPFKSDSHRGIDIAADPGDSIITVSDGIVTWIGKTPRGEPCISVDHPGGISSTYLPVTSRVGKGQKVKAGDTIGTLSLEGDPSSPESHLHLGFYETMTREDKTYLNPAEYLPVANGLVNSDNNLESQEVTQKLDVKPNKEFLQNSPNAETPIALPRAGLVSPTVQDIGLNLATNFDAASGHQSGSAVNAQTEQTSPMGSTAGDSWSAISRVSMQPDSAIGTRSGRLNRIIRDDTYHGKENNRISKTKSVGALTTARIGDTKILGSRLSYVATGSSIDSFRKRPALIDPKRNQALRSNTIENAFRLPSTTSTKKAIIINSANPFVSRKTASGQLKFYRMVGGSLNRKDKPVLEAHGQLGQNFIGSIVAWKSLPDVISMLAIIGLVIISVGRFLSKARNFQNNMPGPASATC